MSCAECEILGTPGGEQNISFGQRVYDLKKCRDAWPGKCIGGCIGGACSPDPTKSLEYARKACAMTEAQHPDGCAAHTLDEGMPKP